MQHGQYPEVPDDFGHWLAGLMDGEGCFDIGRKVSTNGLYRYAFRIVLSLRDDDRPILSEITARTGIGKVYTRSSDREGWGGRATWTAHSKRDIAALIRLFDRFPLRAKKARDYVLWREGATYWLAQRHRVVAGGTHVALDWGPIPHIRQRLMASRAYLPEPGSWPEDPYSSRADTQMSFLDESDASWLAPR